MTILHNIAPLTTLLLLLIVIRQGRRQREEVALRMRVVEAQVKLLVARMRQHQIATGAAAPKAGLEAASQPSPRLTMVEAAPGQRRDDPRR